MQPSFISHNRQSKPRPNYPRAGRGDSRPRVQIEITEGRAHNKMRKLDGPTYFIGSGSDCDMVLGDTQFAEVHAFLVVHSDSVSIRHLGHAPELLINGQAVDRAVLADGDRIQTGPYELIAHIQSLSQEVAKQDSSGDRFGTHRALDRSGSFARIDGPSVGVVPRSVAPPMWQHLGKSRVVAINKTRERTTA